MNLHELGIQGGLEKAAASKRKRGPWKRRLLMGGAAVGGLVVGGSFGRSIAKQYGLKAGMQALPVGLVAGASVGATAGGLTGVQVDRFNKKAAFTPAMFQQAMRVAAGVVKEMSPAMMSGAMTGAAVSAIRADGDKGSAAVKGALMGSLVGGVLGTGGALGAAKSTPHYRELQNTLGLITGGVSGFYTDVHKDRADG
jgi:hypothetical protein